METWQEIIENQSEFDEDTERLQNLKDTVRSFRSQADHSAGNSQNSFLSPPLGSIELP